MFLQEFGVATIYGIIHSCSNLFLKKPLEKIIKQKKDKDKDIIISAICTSISIFFITIIKKLDKNNLYLIENPLIDLSGIIIGALIVITLKNLKPIYPSI
jgi:hypothetical protein